MRTLRKSCALLVLALAACANSSTDAPDVGTVRGSVRDNLDQAMSNVAVSMFREGRAAKTARSDAAGVFTFNNVDVGSWELQVSLPTGYTLGDRQSNPTPVTVQTGKTTTLTVNLAKRTTGPGGPIGPSSH